MNLIYVCGMADQKTQNGPMSPTLLLKIPNVNSTNGIKLLIFSLGVLVRFVRQGLISAQLISCVHV